MNCQNGSYGFLHLERRGTKMVAKVTWTGGAERRDKSDYFYNRYQNNNMDRQVHVYWEKMSQVLSKNLISSCEFTA